MVNPLYFTPVTIKLFLKVRLRICGAGQRAHGHFEFPGARRANRDGGSGAQPFDYP
jgi:hypothetical protein